jgi:hypothetical protein
MPVSQDITCEVIKLVIGKTNLNLRKKFIGVHCTGTTLQASFLKAPLSKWLAICVSCILHSPKEARRRTKPQLYNDGFSPRTYHYFILKFDWVCGAVSFRGREVLIGKYRSAWQHCMNQHALVSIRLIEPSQLDSKIGELIYSPL